MSSTGLYYTRGTTPATAADILAALSGGGLVILLHADETDVTDEIQSSPTQEKSYTLPNNNYSSIIVEAELELAFNPSSLAQFVQIDIYQGTNIKKTFFMYYPAQTGRAALSAKTSFVQKTTSAISIKQHGLTSVDLNTGLITHSLRVYGVT